MTHEITLDELRAMVMQAGLTLSDDELQKLVPGVNRARKQATELRTLTDDNNEPASSFSAQKADKV